MDSRADYIHTENLSRHYQRGPSLVKALDDVSIQVARGEFVAVVGASGSGKSTLLNLLAGLDTPTSGRVIVDGSPLHEMSKRELARHRARRVGMVFQSFNLLPHRTALGNVEVALMFNGTPRAERRTKAERMLVDLGLSERLDHRPSDLSGGEQQRVALARALVKQPDILLADEPTGNLDHDNSLQISQLLTGLNDGGLTVVMVTHDRDLARRCRARIIPMSYGRLAKPEGDDRSES
jgi:putative ABC transport system ATP-binding protein